MKHIDVTIPCSREQLIAAATTTAFMAAANRASVSIEEMRMELKQLQFMITLMKIKVI